MTKELEIRNQLQGIDESKAAQIKAVFEPMVKMLEGFEAAYSQLMDQEQTPEKSAQAKRLRLDIAKVRIEADKVRKDQKEEYLRAGNAIQGVFNILKFAVAEKEESLKSVEEYYDRIEAEKIKQRQAEREAEMESVNADGSQLNLGTMADDAYAILIGGYRSAYEAAQKAEREAEEHRRIVSENLALHNSRREQIAKFARFGSLQKENLHSLKNDEFMALVAEYEKQEAADLAEQERIRKENERLQKANAEAEASRKAMEEQHRKEIAEREAAERKARQEQEAKDRAEREEKARQERERLQAEKAAEEERRKKEAAPDKLKLSDAAQILLTLKDGLKSAEAKAAADKAYTILTTAAKAL